MIPGAIKAENMARQKNGAAKCGPVIKALQKMLLAIS
jgi:hypothetical protein